MVGIAASQLEADGFISVAVLNPDPFLCKACMFSSQSEENMSSVLNKFGIGVNVIVYLMYKPCRTLPFNIIY